MAWSFAFLVALLVLSCTSSCSLGCDLPQSHSQGNRRALIFLGQMKKLSPFTCLKDRNDFGMPWEDVDVKQVQKSQAISVLQEVNQQILNLFCSTDLSTAWEMTLLDKFCTGLYQQLSDLQVCLMLQVGVQEAPLILKDSLVPVRKYFQRITVYLMEKRYSTCAWQVVRAEMLRALSSLACLLERLQSITSKPGPNMEIRLVD